MGGNSSNLGAPVLYLTFRNVGPNANEVLGTVLFFKNGRVGKSIHNAFCEAAQTSCLFWGHSWDHMLAYSFQTSESSYY